MTSEIKKYPYCVEIINLEAIKCKHFGETQGLAFTILGYFTLKILGLIIHSGRYSKCGFCKQCLIQ